MIDLAGLVGRITGKGPALADGTVTATPETGAAGGGNFAALVRLASQVETGRGQGNLRLVVDNGVAPDVAALVAGTVPVGSADVTIAGDAPVTGDGDGDGETESDSLETAAVPAPAPFTLPPVPLPTAPISFNAPAPMPGQVFTPVSVPSSPQALAPVTTNIAVACGAETAVPLSAEQPTAAASGQLPGTPGHVSSPAASTDAAQAGLAAVITPTVSATSPASGASEAVAAQQQAADPARATAIVAAGEGPQQAKPGVLMAAWRMLAPRTKGETPADKAEVVVQLPTMATRQADADEATPAIATGGEPSRAAVPLTGDASASIAPPLRSIVEGLPPVLQAELGTPSVRAVTGPSTGEALGDQVIDMGVSGQWIDRMAQEIAGLADGTGHSRFTLNPPHLGRLQIDLWRDEGATSVRLLAETDEAAQRLSDGRTALQADARIAALSLGTITVEKTNTSLDSGSRDQGSQRQGGDLSGQMQHQQQQAEGQAQSRAGNTRANGSDWVSRIARDEPNQQDETARTPSGAANGRVRFA